MQRARQATAQPPRHPGDALGGGWEGVPRPGAGTCIRKVRTSQTIHSTQLRTGVLTSSQSCPCPLHPCGSQHVIPATLGGGGGGQVASLYIEETEVQGLNRTLEPARGDPASSSQTRIQAFSFRGVVFFIRAPHPLPPPELLLFREAWTSNETPWNLKRRNVCASQNSRVAVLLGERPSEDEGKVSEWHGGNRYGWWAPALSRHSICSQTEKVLRLLLCLVFLSGLNLPPMILFELLICLANTFSINNE